MSCDLFSACNVIVADTTDPGAKHGADNVTLAVVHTEDLGSDILLELVRYVEDDQKQLLIVRLAKDGNYSDS